MTQLALSVTKVTRKKRRLDPDQQKPKSKPLSKREITRATKALLRVAIAAAQMEFRSVTRVPRAVVIGDAVTVARWKAAIASVDTAKIVWYSPPVRSTVAALEMYLHRVRRFLSELNPK